MPRLRHADELWDIAQDGAKLVIVDAGKQTTRKFVSPTHAKIQLDKLVADKLAAGWQLTDEPPPVIQTGEPIEPALEAAVAADPYDATAYAVYGDWYQSLGHPRGELIALQRADRRDGDDRVRKFLVRHKHQLLGELARHDLPGEDSPFTWRLGFIHGLDVVDSRSPIELVRDVLAHPSGRFLCEARLRLTSGDTIAAALDALRAAKLRVLSILTYAEPVELDAIASFPQLRRLAVKLYGEPPRRNALAAIARVTPTLEALDVRVQGDDELWDAFAPLFSRTDLHLRELALRCEGLARTAVRALCESPLAADLVKLDLSETDPDAWVRTLLEHRARFARLELLQLRFRTVAPSALSALQSSIRRVVDQRRDPDLALLPERDDDHYEEIRE